MVSNDKPINLLVVDSSVLIRRAPLKVLVLKYQYPFIFYKLQFFILKDLADTVYAVEGVVGEIRDANTRAYLQVLPFDFKLKEPTADSVKFGSLKIFF